MKKKYIFPFILLILVGSIGLLMIQNVSLRMEISNMRGTNVSDATIKVSADDPTNSSGSGTNLYNDLTGTKHTNIGFLQRANSTKKELTKECNKIVHGEESNYFQGDEGNLINRYKNGLEFYKKSSSNDLVKLSLLLKGKTKDEGIVILKSELLKISKTKMGYLVISDVINGTNTCIQSKKETVAVCEEQIDIIKSFLGEFNLSLDKMRTIDYTSIYFYSVSNGLNFIDEFNTVFMRECLGLGEK